MSEGTSGDERPATGRRGVLAPMVALGLVVALAAAGWPARTPPASARSATSAASAAPSTRTLPPLRPTRVLVLGDSVMKGADARYGAALPGREVVVDTEVSRSTGAGAEVLARRGNDWDVVVVLLGHNDGGSPGVYQPAARRILDQLRGVRRVSWLTLHEVRPSYPGVNQFLTGLTADYPNLHIADWHALVAANPGAVAGDGLHLRPQGAELMAGLVARQVEEAEYEFAVALNRLAASVTTTTAPITTTTTAPPTTAVASTVATTASPQRGRDQAGAGPEDASATAPSTSGDQGTAGTSSEAPAITAAAAGVAALVLAATLVVTRRRRRHARSASR